MSVNTWTPTALASEARPWSGSGWRAVEAQNQVATMGLVHGDVKRQALLEDILEEVKPAQPSETTGLHWLLFTPFRYRPLPSGSRFRRRQDPGVFYGAVDRKTACAESGYWRLRFWMDSEYLREKTQSVPVTLFEFHGEAHSAINLTANPFVTESTKWMSPDDYTATQELADVARLANVEVIRHGSVRNHGGDCIAVLSPDVFKRVDEPFRENLQSWTLTICPPANVVWQRSLSSEGWAFDFKACVTDRCG